MASDFAVEISLRMAFPKAGVAFTIEAGRGGAFHLAVNDSGGRPVPLDPESSPQLADWARGYARWLYRANVKASHGRDGVTGSFVDGLTPDQVLIGVRDACDMIRQRFELYEESILTGTGG